MDTAHTANVSGANLEVIDHLAEAWNPIDASGTIGLISETEQTVRLQFRGQLLGKQLSVTSGALPQDWLAEPEHRRSLARAVHAFLTHCTDHCISVQCTPRKRPNQW